MTSLGFRPRIEHTAQIHYHPRRPAPVAQAETCATPSRRRWRCNLYVARGLLPVLIYSAVAFSIPTLIEYVDYDFSDRNTRIGTVAVAAAAATVMLAANCCACWYNMALFFHIALEARVIETLFDFAYASDTSDVDMAWSVAAIAIVILHLVPFLLLDRVVLLTALAYAGVVVNSAVLVFLDPGRLLLVGASSIALLATTMIVAGVCEVHTSLFAILRKAVRTRMLIRCRKFEL